MNRVYASVLQPDKSPRDGSCCSPGLRRERSELTPKAQSNDFNTGKMNGNKTNEWKQAYKTSIFSPFSIS